MPKENGGHRIEPRSQLDVGAHDDVKTATKATIAIGRLRRTAVARDTGDLTRGGGHQLTGKQFRPGQQ